MSVSNASYDFDEFGLFLNFQLQEQPHRYPAHHQIPILFVKTKGNNAHHNSENHQRHGHTAGE